MAHRWLVQIGLQRAPCAAVRASKRRSQLWLDREDAIVVNSRKPFLDQWLVLSSHGSRVGASALAVASASMCGVIILIILFQGLARVCASSPVSLMFLECLSQHGAGIPGRAIDAFSSKVALACIAMPEALSYRSNFVESRSSLPRTRKVVNAVHTASLTD